MSRRRELLAGVAALGLVYGGAVPGGAALASIADEERVFRQDALAHAEAVAVGYRQLEEHILLDSTGVTSWTGSVPPLSTGWKASWTARGVRARYCDETLLVYLHPAELKGVGGDHRSVHSAPHAFVGEGNQTRFPPLHWLDGNRVTKNSPAGTVPVVALPACMTGDALPSGRAALAGTVKDPHLTVNKRPGVEHEYRSQPCATGKHGPGIREYREITFTLDGRGEEVPGTRVVGSWQELVDACRDDYTEWVHYTKECTWTAGAPHNREMVGEEVWRVQETVTGAGRTRNPPGEFVSTTCWSGLEGEHHTAEIDERSSQQSMTVACGQGFTGSRRYTRTETVRSTQFPWDAAPVVTTRYTSWKLASSSCVKIEPPEPEKPFEPKPCDSSVEQCDGTVDEDPDVDPEKAEVAQAGTYTVDVDETRTRDCSTSDPSLTGTYVETRTVRYTYELKADGTRTETGRNAGVWWTSKNSCRPKDTGPTDPPGPSVGPSSPSGPSCGPPGDGSASPGEGECTGMDASIAAAVAAATGSGGGPGGGAGGCYLTTAVVEHRGIEADDGPTLTALRHFRDTYMMETPLRRALVRLYYRLAPAISRDLHADSAAWDQIGRHIDAAVEALESGNRGQAFRAYWAASTRAFSLWAAFKIRRALG